LAWAGHAEPNDRARGTMATKLAPGEITDLDPVGSVLP
jgi:hypothetical protein